MRRGSRLAAVGVGLAALAASPTSAAALAPGDIVVVDQNAFADFNGGLIKVDPATGQQSAISSNAISGADLFASPRAIVLDRRGNLLIADPDAMPDGSGAVIRVDPDTGQQSLVSANSISGPNLFVEPIGLALEPRGDLLVSDRDATGDGSGALIRVDVATGGQTLVSTNAISAPDRFQQPRAVVLAGARNAFIADPDSGGPTGAVLRVDVATGQQSEVSSNAGNPPGFFSFPIGIDLDAEGDILLTDDSSFGDQTGGVIEVDPATGAQTVLVSNDSTGGPDLLEEPRATTFELDGSLLVSDASGPQMDATGVVARVDLAAGEQSIASNNIVSGPDLFSDPKGVLVYPPRCGGRLATLYGTPDADRLKGTPAPDVIAGLGGSDVIKGLAGRDRLCGGAGRDKLVGGKGRDRLFGGKGRDRLFGGRGRDLLRGGPARDKLRGGPGPDRQVQ